MLSGIALAALGVAMSRQVERANAQRERETRHRPVEVRDDGYISSSECRSCHPNEYASWHRSYHRTMTQAASPHAIRGDFENVMLGADPGYQLTRDGDEFYVTVPAPEPQRRRITMVTGSHHMQVYWYETEESRKLGMLPYVYLFAEQRWIPRGAAFIEPPRSMPRVDETGRWAQSCILCHATQGRPRRSEHNAFDTQVAELGIACEACHGPGEAHVTANRSPLARYSRYLAAADGGKIVNPRKIDRVLASQICSQCHAVWQHQDREALQRWNDHGLDYRPGDDHTKSMWLLQPSQADQQPRIAKVLRTDPSYADGQFWSDGGARVSGREYSGMIDSPCYQRGELSCLSCHTMHKRAGDPRSLSAWADDQLGAGMDGDRACLQCHTDYRQADRLTEHTRHPAESSGSRCYNCHMPYTSYGLMKAMRSHRIDVPDARSTIETGRPNACNLCHLDKSIGWAADQLHAAYGIEKPALTDDQKHVPAAVYQGVTGDAGERALIAWALGWEPARRASERAFMPELLGLLMDDPYDAVRYIAERSFRSLPGVDLHGLDYDFVTRPGQRPPVAADIARRGGAVHAGATAQFKPEIDRLMPWRDHRPVLLLE